MPSVLPNFRKDLQIVPRAARGGRDSYVIKDQQSGEVFELGEEEYFLCFQLDGQTDLSTVQARFEEHFHVPLTLDHLEAFVRQMEAQGLLVSKTTTTAATEYSAVKKQRLFDPDRLLSLLASSFSWCFSPLFAVVTCLVLILALGVALKFGSHFIAELRIVWDPGHLFLVAILGLFLGNLLGEIAKGVACKHYGGHVREFGMWFLYRIIPRFYSEMSDILWMRRKSHRIWILSAGMISQLLLWAVSIIGWKNTAPWTNLHTFWLLLTVVSTLAFFLNLNPLMKRDGYYLLSTWLEIPDLRNRAVALTRSWILRRPLPEPLTSKEILGFKWYGLLSVGFEIILWILILCLCGYLLIWHWNLKGTGACLFLALLALRFEDTLKRQCMRIPFLRGILANEAGSIKLRRLVKFGLPTIIILIMFIPYPFTVGGGFRLLPVHQLGIRAQVPGDIKSVLVKENQWVEKGQAVALLVGRNEKRKVEVIKADLDEANANLQLLQEGAKPEEIAKAEQEVTKVAKSLEYSILQADRYQKMFKNKAVSEEDYENALRQRDLDQERLELAKKTLELVKSGARDEEIKALEAEIRRLEVNLAHAEEDLRLTTLVSPADGRIITPYLSQTVGQYLSVGDLFAVVEDSRTIIAEIEVPEEDVGEVEIGTRVKLRTWAHPNSSFTGNVVTIAPVAYEKSKGRVERTLSEREWRIEQKEILREKGKVVRVLCELSNADDSLKTDMTGYAKIDSGWKPVGIAFTRWLVRFLLVEVWSWIP